MAQVKIEGIFDHLGHEIRRALEETIKEHFPSQKHDIRAVFRTFGEKYIISAIPGKPYQTHTDEQKLHTEAIRSDEVPHAAEVQHLERGQCRNSRRSRHRHKDIRLTEGGLGLYGLQIEKSAEVIVVDRT